MRLIYKSNFSAEEQYKSVLGLLKKDDAKKICFSLGNHVFSGFRNSKFIIARKADSEESEEKLEIVQYLNAGFIAEILVMLEKKPIHRLFTVRCDEERVVVVDNLMNETSKTDILCNKFDEFLFDSRIITYFRLNKKTLTRKTLFIKTRDGSGLLVQRKREIFCFLLFEIVI